MHIISHRGLWHHTAAQNSAKSFEDSFRQSYGVETDIREYDGRLVIAHDLADKESIPFSDFLEIYDRMGQNLPVALNVKSDGLQNLLLSEISQSSLKNFFVFDMSAPQTFLFQKMNFPFYARQSEFEKEPQFYNQCKGIWLDSFLSDWYEIELIKKHIANGKSVAVVSPELHKRNYLDVWSMLKELSLAHTSQILLCTDYPNEARSYFND